MSHPWRSYNTTMEIVIFRELNSPVARGDKVVESIRSKLPRKEEF